MRTSEQLLGEADFYLFAQFIKRAEDQGGAFGPAISGGAVNFPGFLNGSSTSFYIWRESGFCFDSVGFS